MTHERTHKQFLELIKNNQSILHKICFIYSRNKGDKEDLQQEIILQLWKSYPSFQGNAAFSTWMYRVALNTAITLYRKSKKVPRTQDFDAVLYRVRAEYYDPSEEQQLNLMYSAIRELGDIDKALIFLYLEDKNYSEIAETLGISEVNARVKMNRIKNKLKTILNP